MAHKFREFMNFRKSALLLKSKERDSSQKTQNKSYHKQHPECTVDQAPFPA